ncbi:hypothetical protein MLD38_013213 [Melastoma candidum]|uniref:Uncharacterized protein n=1 Tax=Melastoma candidum TaxID=119954 RepID=A0ACB9R8W7_9MYRT|nr:hypothetical protein MLD38_013213 [Melastoma candidum]
MGSSPLHEGDDPSRGDDPSAYKESRPQLRSPRSPLSPHSPRSDALQSAVNDMVDLSIEQLYHNVCDMCSSDQSPSRYSFLSYGEESRIDSELGHLVGGFCVAGKKSESNNGAYRGSPGAVIDCSGRISERKSVEGLPISMQRSPRPIPWAKSSPRRHPVNRRSNRKQKDNGVVGKDSSNLGHLFLKRAKEIILTEENPEKALELAVLAVKSYEKSANGDFDLEFVVCLHVLATIYCNLGEYHKSIPFLKRSIDVLVSADSESHALAKFAGHMQLGDVYALIGQIDNSIPCYMEGLELQRKLLGYHDARVGETLRYIAEAHVQALRFDEAAGLCQMALYIHKENGTFGSLEEAADRRLMGLICDAKGEHEHALEHYVLASMAIASHGQELDVASIDCNIGDAYLSLLRYDEAVFAYQKALTVFKLRKGENHPMVASVYVRLADLYNKVGKFRESRIYCENAMRIYSRRNHGILPQAVASGLLGIAAVYQSLNELESALKLLKKALQIYDGVSGHQGIQAGIEAQIGVLLYMMGRHSDSCITLKSAIEKLRAGAERNSTAFGIALNQMGLACLQCYALSEAAEHFEEAREILEKELGPYHPDTLGIYSNLAGTYDALGRLDDAIELLEYVVRVREEKLGTANSDVGNEKRRLAELLNIAGREASRKPRPLESLMGDHSRVLVAGCMNV